MLRGKWWEIFKEPELNSLEEQLNINNQNIKQAFENFLAARAQIREAWSQYFPTVTTAPDLQPVSFSLKPGRLAVARGTSGVATLTGQHSYSLPAACGRHMGA